jgi:hypothetical protein
LPKQLLRKEPTEGADPAWLELDDAAITVKAAERKLEETYGTQGGQK